MTRRWWSAALGLVLLAGCNTDGNDAVLADEAHEEQALTAAKALIQGHLDELAEAAEELRGAAPAADDDGWNAKDDAAAVAAMRAAWLKARAAYTAVETPASVLFPALHHNLDTDYDDLIADTPDRFLFDEHGVRGLQGVERILWSDVMPAHVLAHESALGNYVAADFPRDDNQAAEFIELLDAFEADVEALRDGFRATELDPDTAYSMTTLSLQEQLGQLEEAGKGEAKARYSGVSLINLRNSFAATKAMYAVFRPWILAKSGGAHTDEEVGNAFVRLEAAYAKPPGQDLPLPPANWLATDPSDEMLATAFGLLFGEARTEADSSMDGTLCFEMVEAAGLLGVTAAY